VPFNTVSDLTSEVASLVDREDDATFVTKIASFILLLEGDLRRELRNRAIRTAITLNAATVALPSAVGEVRSLRFNTGVPSADIPLLPRTPDQLAELRAMYPATGKPVYFAVVDRSLMLVPAPDASYTGEIIYMQAYVPVATDPALIATAPDLYLYGVMQHAAPWLEHDERNPDWEKRYTAALIGLNLQREREEFGLLQRQAQRLPRVFGERP